MAGVVTTTTIEDTSVFGTRRVVAAKLAFDTGDYASGGIAVTPAQFGLQVIKAMLFQGASIDSNTSANVAGWDPANSKILLFESDSEGDPLDQKPAEAMLASTLRVFVIGY